MAGRHDEIGRTDSRTLRRIEAGRVHRGHIVEWCGRRCSVLAVQDGVRQYGHRRQRASRRAAVLLTVVDLDPAAERRTLHYWTDELVTLVGLST